MGNLIHICHLTVLNPVTHPRVYFKLAHSQQALGYQVTVIGQASSHMGMFRNSIECIELPVIHRLSWKRFIWIPVLLLRSTLICKADIYWIHTPELVWLGLYWKMRGKKIVYDVHEDYYKTLLYARHYPLWLRRPLAWFWRRVEILWVKYLDAVVYAEECYDDMLSVGAKKKVILRNKFSKQNIYVNSHIPIPTTPYLLYTGTIAPEWGIWKTLDFWKKIYPLTHWQLIVAGFTFQQDLIKELLHYVEEIGLKESFTLYGGTQMVPYHDIVELIRHCKGGMALYDINPVIQGKIPTKFYEYMAYDKPLVYTSEPFWEKFDEKYHLGVAFDKQKALGEVWKELEEWSYLHEPEEYSWESEVQVMKNLLRGISSGSSDHRG